MLEGSDPAPKMVALAPGSPVRVCVIGTGYVGLVTAACLAALGHQVTAVDVDVDKMSRLECGELPFHEGGLAALIRTQLASKRLCFTASGSFAIACAELVFVTVGTPARRDGSTDMRGVDAVVNSLCEVARAPTVIVMKSTVPVGTARDIAARLVDRCGSDAAPTVLCNPEFLREGCAVDDFMAPDRIIIGHDTPSDTASDVPSGTPSDPPPDTPALRLMQRLYAPLIAAGVPILTMDTRSAELSKHAANAMLALRISFVNELAGIAAATGADIERVSDGVGSDPRIGPHFLRPGLGYGGSCFAKDVAALRETARRYNLRSDLLLATERVNRRQRCWALNALVRDFGSRAALRGLRLALWGLAFKPGTDDIRDAPGLALLSWLNHAGAVVSAFDPVAMPNARAAIGDAPRLSWAVSAAAALEGADVLLLATEWPEFVAFDPRSATVALECKTVYDGRNVLDPATWSAAGVRLVQVGRALPEQTRARAARSPDLLAVIAAPQISPVTMSESIP